ncbi:Hypothetical protein NTJ_03898 [Nesidiocoris tenuis]|uniref:Uncharacterized protein n=1 Tax=Nesidiocoris tenuis TaxID=355587 RepID=A0ABN7AFS1_9HEMI|nr:Hypothetical protein NTJ_03898 [Nesidiocoris tenuis]
MSDSGAQGFIWICFYSVGWGPRDLPQARAKAFPSAKGTGDSESFPLIHEKFFVLGNMASLDIPNTDCQGVDNKEPSSPPTIVSRVCSLFDHCQTLSRGGNPPSLPFIFRTSSPQLLPR